MNLQDDSYISLQLGYCPTEKGIVGLDHINLEYRLVDTVFPRLSSDAVKVYLALRYLQNLEDAAPTPILPIINQRFCPNLDPDKFNAAVEELTHLFVNGTPLVFFETEDRDLIERQNEISIEIRGRGHGSI